MSPIGGMSILEDAGSCDYIWTQRLENEPVTNPDRGHHQLSSTNNL